MQIARFSKLDLFALIFRGYGTQRCHNYYEILEVPSNCSQKEIRNAFITLSKKFHPDIIGQKGHDKFVMVQEAYNVLSKEHTRKQYDMSLKYNTHPSYSSNPHPRTEPYSYRVYRSRREWEEEMAKGTWRPNHGGQKSTNHQFVIYVVFGVVCLFVQLIMYEKLSNLNLLRMKYQREYNDLEESLKGLSREEQRYLILEKMRLAKENKNKRKYNDEQ